MIALGGWFSDTWDLLTGKPQSWYTNVSNIQKQLGVVLAGVTAAGKDLWNTVSQASVGPTQDGSPASGVDDYDQVLGDIDAKLKSIIVTRSQVPDDATIGAAQATAAKYQRELDFVTAMAPEMSAQIAADQRQLAAMLPGTMTSPSGAGKEEFFKALDERASALGEGVSDILKYAAMGLGALALIYALGKMT